MYHWVAVDQLNVALPMFRLPVCQEPHISGDAGVVEHVERQCDDGLQPVVLDDPAPDVTLTLSGVPGEKGTSVVDFCYSAAEGCVPPSSC